MTYIRINLRMTLRIMFLDMLKVGRLLKARDIPIQMPKPFMYSRIIMTDHLVIRLEVLDVYRIKAGDSRV